MTMADQQQLMTQLTLTEEHSQQEPEQAAWSWTAVLSATPPVHGDPAADKLCVATNLLAEDKTKGVASKRHQQRSCIAALSTPKV